MAIFESQNRHMERPHIVGMDCYKHASVFARPLHRTWNMIRYYPKSPIPHLSDMVGYCTASFLLLPRHNRSLRLLAQDSYKYVFLF